MRSLLMVPAHRRRCLDKCLSLGADAIVFDLEDSVPEDKKDEALQTLMRWRQENTPRMATYVRINPKRALWEVRELVAFFTGFMVPKVRDTYDIPDICVGLPTILVIETAAAVLNLERLMGMKDVVGAVFGVGDFSADMGVIDRPWMGSVNNRFGYVKQKMAVVCKAFEKMCLDTSFYVRGSDARDQTYNQWKEVASWGFTGASPIHPSHVGIANEVFMPTRTEIRWAGEVLNGAEDHNNEVYVDREGFAVGPPHVRQAKCRQAG